MILVTSLSPSYKGCLNVWFTVSYEVLLPRVGNLHGHTPRQPLQNRPSGRLGGWATPWSVEEMLDGLHQRMDIPAHARAADKGLLQKRLEEALCWIVPHVPPTTQMSRDWAELNCPSWGNPMRLTGRKNPRINLLTSLRDENSVEWLHHDNTFRDKEASRELLSWTELNYLNVWVERRWISIPGLVSWADLGHIRNRGSNFVANQTSEKERHTVSTLKLLKKKRERKKIGVGMGQAAVARSTNTAAQPAELWPLMRMAEIDQSVHSTCI